MNVRELREKLAEFDSETQVQVCVGDLGEMGEVVEVTLETDWQHLARVRLPVVRLRGSNP